MNKMITLTTLFMFMDERRND